MKCLERIYVFEAAAALRSLRKNYVQIINNKEAPWITLSKQHLAHDSQLEQQLSLASLLLRAELGAGLRVVWFSADTFQLLTKESKERKKLAWGTELCLGNCFHCMQISKITLRLYSYISTLWDVLSITTDILFKSSSSELSMGRRRPNYKSLTLLPEHHQTSRYPYKGSSWVFSN